MDVRVAAHPLLDLGLLLADLPRTVGETPSPDWLRALLVAPTPVAEEVRAAVRDALRGGGYRPTGRGKPASEYLVRAAGEGKLGPINVAVDAGNAVSLATGLPVSVVDLDRVRPPLTVDVAPPGASFVFNAAGQVIDVAGLPCLIDADGPCANAVKDAVRTKTGDATRHLLGLVWGTRALPGRTAGAVALFDEVLTRAGADVLR
jgi:DNA/RNA-binding domain of Phe-tRNA-synthetase-like protein